MKMVLIRDRVLCRKKLLVGFLSQETSTGEKDRFVAGFCEIEFC